MRIKELAREAGLNAPYGSDHEGLRDFDYRKFADLLLQECISTCSKLWYEENNKQRTIEQEDPRSIGLQVGVKGGILKCVNALSKLKNEKPDL